MKSNRWTRMVLGRGDVIGGRQRFVSEAARSHHARRFAIGRGAASASALGLANSSVSIFMGFTRTGY